MLLAINACAYVDFMRFFFLMTPYRKNYAPPQICPCLSPLKLHLLSPGCPLSHVSCPQQSPSAVGQGTVKPPALL